MFATVKECELQLEIDDLKREIAILQHICGQYVKPKDTTPLDISSIGPEPTPTITLIKSAELVASVNGYGATHVCATSSTGNGSVKYDYYVAGLHAKNASPHSILGEAHFNFVNTLARMVREGKY